MAKNKGHKIEVTKRPPPRPLMDEDGMEEFLEIWGPAFEAVREAMDATEELESRYQMPLPCGVVANAGLQGVMAFDLLHGSVHQHDDGAPMCDECAEAEEQKAQN